MSTFSEQLVNARKHANMTQEELAQAVFVTRATVSSWERGRTFPDVGTIQKLTEVLHCEFVFGRSGDNKAQDAGSAGNDSTAPVQAEQAPESGPAGGNKVQAGEDEKNTAGRKKWLLPALCGAAAVVVACILWLVLPSLRKPAEPEDVIVEQPDAVEMDVSALVLTEPKRFTREWFQEGNVPAKGEPYLKFHPQVKVEKSGPAFDYWYYILGFEEVTGRKFTLEKLDQFEYTGEVTYNRLTFIADGKLIWEADNGYAWEFAGGLPVQDGLWGYGFIVYGHDEQGHPMSFRAYIDMLEAPR